MNKRLIAVSLTFLTLPTIAWSAAEHCNALLNLGLYNVAQSSSAADGQSMSKSTFCSADYSMIDQSSTQAAAIKASYGLFSGGASGSASSRDIEIKQSSVCTSGFSSAAYSDKASEYARVVYQGSLDAWNKCQTLASKGLVFEVLPSSSLQGVSVIMTAPTGLKAKFMGVTQFGQGHSDCTTTLNGVLKNVGPSTPIAMTAASKVTVNCSRQMETVGDDLIADQQDLVFSTSADTMTVPLAAIGSMARATADQIKADANTSIEDKIAPINSQVNDLNNKINIVKSKSYITSECRIASSNSWDASGASQAYCNSDEVMTGGGGRLSK